MKAILKSHIQKIFTLFQRPLKTQTPPTGNLIATTQKRVSMKLHILFKNAKNVLAASSPFTLIPYLAQRQKYALAQIQTHPLIDDFELCSLLQAQWYMQEQLS